MASTFTVTEIAVASFTITLGSLAAAAGRQSTMITNSSNHRRALITASIKSGTAPTAGGTYTIYLIRYDGTNRDDNAGAADAAWTYVCAPLLATFTVTASTNTLFTATFTTELLGDLGSSWGIGVMNNSSQALNASGSSITYRYQDDVVA